MEKVQLSIKIENLAHAYQRASSHLINSYKEPKDLAILIPAIFCSKHAAELYLKAILSALGVSKFHHNQKKLFDILEKKLLLKLPKNNLNERLRERLDTLKMIVDNYGNNKIGGVFINLPNDFENTNFRYTKENVAWVNDLKQIDCDIFQDELKNLKNCAIILCGLARVLKQCYN